MIHLKALDELAFIKVDRNRSLLAEIVDLYSAQTPIKITSLYRAVNSGRQSETAQIAHSLKASSAYLGLEDMVGLCVALEEWGKKEQPQNIVEAKTYLAALEDTFEDSARELHRYISKNEFVKEAGYDRYYSVE